MADKHEGGCQCGAIRFATEGAPKFVANCHCRSCRKAIGAAFSTWIGFNDDQVKWTKGAPTFYASSPGVKRGYCPACGTPLSYASDKWAGETHFLIGVFDEPEAFTPKGDAFADEALSWSQKIKEGA
jgi:hypothetical protein